MQHAKSSRESVPALPRARSRPSTTCDFVNNVDNLPQRRYRRRMNSSAELLESLSGEVRRSFRDLSQAAELALDPLGVTASDRAILEFLAVQSAPVSLSELARRSSVSRQHIHQSIRRLPNSGWVESAASPDDHRVVLLRLTREGRAFWRKVRAADQRFLSRFARRFRSEELRVAISVLQRIRSELGSALDRHAEGG